MRTKENFCEKLIIAGFGGQGILLSGKLLANTAMLCGYQVTYMPSYGAEIRGGTANCMLVISDDLIASPIIAEPDAIIVMNQASFDKFVPKLKTGGLLVLNSSLVQSDIDRDDIEILAVPANKIADKLKSPRSANMAALGAYLQKRQFISPQNAADTLPKVLAKRRHKTIPTNTKAILAGADFAENSSSAKKKI